MARQNVAFIAFNRGLMSPKAMARVDLDRTQLSAEVMTNWLPKTQGSMTIRPGTKYIGSSYNDTGATWLEFVAATDDTALIELTHNKMRVWIDDVLLARPAVTTAAHIYDTGWDDASTGGTLTTGSPDLIPPMLAQSTDGVEVTASSSNVLTPTTTDLATGGLAWNAADADELVSVWQDTGDGNNTMPSWWNVDLDSSNTLDTGLRQSVKSYHLAASAYRQGAAPRAWRLLGGNFDTGTYATDTGKWTLEDEETNQIDWGLSERRVFAVPGSTARRHWRLHFVATDTGSAGSTPPRFLRLANISMYGADSASKVKQVGGQMTLNATAIGPLARARKRGAVSVSNLNIEHSLSIVVARGPVTLRVGSAVGEDDYISNTQLGTGRHNLSFTPSSDFFITLQSDATVDRVVRSLEVGDTGTVELTTDWAADDLNNIRYDQSADVVYITCDEKEPHKIERRGDGRSWSIVEFESTAGPFLSLPSSEARLSISAKYGNTDMNSDIPFFNAGHVGALFRQTHSGQSGVWALGALEAATDAVQLVGVSDTGDTGTPTQESERRLNISVSGTYAGTITIERSFDGDDFGFHAVSESGGYIKPFNGNSSPSDTGTFSRVINDNDDNVPVWYRARMSAYTSGAAVVTFTYPGLSTSGIAKVTDFYDSTTVGVEVLQRFSDTGSTDVWQEGSWSVARGHPAAVALHGGRLCLGKGATISLSASDDYENFDDTLTGDAAPILRTLGSGSVDNIYYLLSLLRLVIGTAGAEIALRSSSLDEPVTAENSNARTFSTRGSANIRPVKLDNRGIFVQRSGRRVFLIGFSDESLEGDYGVQDMTSLVPDLLEAGVVSIAVQRQPDTRIHCVLANGKVGILTFEPLEELLCWSMWESGDTGEMVERAMVLPAPQEDRVYYHIRRTVNGVTKRYLERWAMESECVGDTGLTWLMDCAKSYTDTGRTTTLTGFQHLAGRQAVVWSDDTGSIEGVDRSPESVGGQTLYVVDTGGAPGFDTGTVVLVQPVHHAVVGLPYTATWKSTKLAYGAEAGTALAQLKRTDKIGFLLYRTHNNGLFFGNDTGTLDPLPRSIDAGAVVDADKIYEALDQIAMTFPGLWSADSRIVLRGKAPRPVTVLAAVPTVATNERI